MTQPVLLVKASEAARILGISRREFDRRCRRLLPVFRTHRKGHALYPVAAVIELAERLTRGPVVVALRPRTATGMTLAAVTAQIRETCRQAREMERLGS